jgi:lipid A disaccharide synthetase
MHAMQHARLCGLILLLYLGTPLVPAYAQTSTSNDIKQENTLQKEISKVEIKPQARDEEIRSYCQIWCTALGGLTV